MAAERLSGKAAESEVKKRELVEVTDKERKWADDFGNPEGIRVGMLGLETMDAKRRGRGRGWG